MNRPIAPAADAARDRASRLTGIAASLAGPSVRLEWLQPVDDAAGETMLMLHETSHGSSYDVLLSKPFGAATAAMPGQLTSRDGRRIFAVAVGRQLTYSRSHFPGGRA